MKIRILFLGLLITLLFNGKVNGQIVPNGNFNNGINSWFITGNNMGLSSNNSSDILIVNSTSSQTSSPIQVSFVLKSSNFSLLANKIYNLDLKYIHTVDHFFSAYNNVTRQEYGISSIKLKDVITNNTIIDFSHSNGVGFPDTYTSSNFTVNSSNGYYLEIDGKANHDTWTDNNSGEFENTQFLVDKIDLSEKKDDHTILGKASFDLSNNSCTTGSYLMHNIQLKTTGTNGTYYASTNSSGGYAFAFEENGTVTTEIVTQGLSSVPITNTFTSGTAQTETNQDFCVSSSSTGDDVSVLIIPTSDARPGFNSRYRIEYINTGSTTVSGDVLLNFEDFRMHSPVSIPAANSTSINSLTWNYSGLTPFETRVINVEFINNTPTQTTNPLIGGESFNFIVGITPLSSDVNQSDNQFYLSHLVVNSYDPNDATILEGAQISAAQATQDLHFRIRFQNTGTASAINVNIKTILDADLDWSTFTPITASDSYNTTVNSSTGEVNFNFPTINLPDSTADEPNSHGWVLFKAKPKTSFAIGDTIDCGADIFFDYNFPIVTNVAQTEIFVPSSLYTLIPDINFEQALIDLGHDNVIDGKVLTANISGLTSLDVSDPLNNTNLPSVTVKITDLTGIEDFVALKNLNCRLNQISNIDLSKNILLETLDIFSNQLTSLDVSQNINLNKIDCQLNQVTTIDVSMNILLEDFNAGSNQLTTIDFTNNTVLKIVNVSMNQLNNVNVLGITTLDTFNVSDNLLTAIDVTTNTNLRAFFINKNSISNLDLSNNTVLDSFYFSDNQFSVIDFSASKNIRVVKGQNNLLISLDLSIFPKIFDLDLSNNSLLSLNIANGNNAGLVNFNISNNTGLTCITADATTPTAGLTGWVKDAPHIFSPTLCLNNLTYVPDDNLETYLETHDANGNVVPFGDPTSMGNGTGTTLVLDNYVFTNRINTVTKLEVPNLAIVLMTGIEDFAALKYLDCNTNLIANIDVTQNTLLEDFRCDYNSLTNLNISINTKLFNLSATRNQLATLDVTLNTDLKVLELFDNQLAVLNVANNLKLEHLGYGDNLFTTSVDTSVNTALTLLRCDYNAISSINVTTNVNLVTLIAGDGNLAALDVSQNTKLESLSVLRGALTSLNLSTNVLLRDLFLESNALTGLDLSLNTGLLNLLLKNNQLTTLNIANGTNTNIPTSSFDIINNPSLTCIEVDDVTYANTNWTNIDAGANFNTDCSTVWTVMTNPTTTTALLAITGLDADNDGNITIAEAASFTGTLDLSGLSLTDVEGLQAFTNVTVIDLQNNNITDFSPLTDASIPIYQKSTGATKTQARTGAFNLEELLISNNNGVQSLDVSKLTKLKKLVIKDNLNLITLSIKNGNNAAITDFDSSNTPNLTCILVDDVNAGYLSSWTKDVKSTYVADEADCRARVLSINDFDISNQISLYPNPVNDILKITISNGLEIKSIEVLNILGKRIVKTTSTEIRFTNLKDGIYLLRINTNKGVITKKVIKN